MDMMLPVAIVIANVMGAGMVLAQVLRIRRTRSASGVSATWIGVGLALNSWWFAYGSAQGLWGLVPVSAGSFVFYTVMAIQLRRLTFGASDRPLVVGLVATWLVPAGSLVAGGWAGAGLAVGLAYGVQFSPAVLGAFRTADVRGISTATWAMAFIEAAIWIVYGAVVHDAAVLIGGIGGSLMAGAILIRVGLGRRVADEAAAPALAT